MLALDDVYGQLFFHRSSHHLKAKAHRDGPLASQR